MILAGALDTLAQSLLRCFCPLPTGFWRDAELAVQYVRRLWIVSSYLNEEAHDWPADRASRRSWSQEDGLSSQILRA